MARFAILGIPAVNLGAGSPLLAHKQDEQLPETDLLLSLIHISLAAQDPSTQSLIKFYRANREF